MTTSPPAVGTVLDVHADPEVVLVLLEAGAVVVGEEVVDAPVLVEVVDSTVVDGTLLDAWSGRVVVGFVPGSDVPPESAVIATIGVSAWSET